MRKGFVITATALAGVLVGVLLGFLGAGRRMKAADSETLFARKIRCQQIAQQLQQAESKDYDYLQYEDIGYSAKRDSCIAGVKAFRGRLEVFAVEDLLSRTTLWSDSCISGKDCDREDALTRVQKEQLAKF
jgi:hypothetical protein